MKTVNLLLLTILMSFNAATAQKNDKDVTNILNVHGPVIGQKPPGLIPELFAPDLVSTKNLEIEGVFAPGMKEFYFVRQVDSEVPKTHVIQLKDGQWQESVLEDRYGEISLSTDGKIMYLGKEFRKRTKTGWSENKNLGPQFEKFPIMRLTASAADTYVFDEREEIGTIRYSQLIKGKREEPKAFGNNINTGKWTAHPFIAPDESYVIWDSEREGGYGASDLYISFRQEDNTWGPAINMGEEINTKYDDAYGSVTPDGNYFFFHTIHLDQESPEEGKANIFWVDAQVIDNLRHQ